MAKPFLVSKNCRDFCMYDVTEFTEEKAFEYFCIQRWGSLEKQICSDCGAVDKHYYRKGRRQWRCKHCDNCFGVTSGTPLANHKLTFKKMLVGMFLYTSSVKGISCGDLSRKLNVNIKTAFMLIGKFRECLLSQRDVTPLKGIIHIDGGHFGGKPRKPNVRRKQNPEDVASKVEHIMNKKKKKMAPSYAFAGTKANIERRKKRRIVMVLREVHPEAGLGAQRTIVSIAMSEDSYSAETLMHRYVEKGSSIMSDENGAYSRLSQWYKHEAVEHSKEFVRPDGVNENQAEAFFSRLRRCEYGVVHRITYKYLMDLSNEMAWREDTRRFTEGERFLDILKKIFKNGLSIWWRGYHQGRHRESELLLM